MISLLSQLHDLLIFSYYSYIYKYVYMYINTNPFYIEITWAIYANEEANSGMILSPMTLFNADFLFHCWLHK